MAVIAAASLTAVSAIAERVGRDARRVQAPRCESFEQFLLDQARVPIGGGEYGRYSFAGREALLGVVRAIDEVLAVPLADSRIGVAGGAQFGKTILELNLAAYATSQRWLRLGLFLPTEDLVQGLVDTKLRPDVIDQIPWFAEMTQVGKAVNKSGKQANRKGAFTVTDGQRRSYGIVLGLQRIPTSYTIDIACEDEVDDIPEKTAKFVKGRYTSSDLRFHLRIGTQRVAGRGQHKVWKDGSQGVVLLGPAGDTAARGAHAPSASVTATPPGWINAEESFPAIVRCQLGDAPSPGDPRLTWAGDFRHSESGELVATHTPDARYYLAHPETGEPLDRRHPLWLHRAPERLAQRNRSFRISQLGIDAIGLSQIVAQFQLAVADPDEMTVFRCDVLALPQSTAQALTPAVVDRARGVESYDARLALGPGRSGFAGLDTGDKCWLWVNESESAARRRLVFAASHAAADFVDRAERLYRSMGLAALFIDQRPLVSQARELALRINDLAALASWPEADETAWISLPGGLRWNPVRKRWSGLRCAVVRFDKKSIGAGIEHGFDLFEEGGVAKFVPLIRCNREETIDRAVRSFLTPLEGVNDVIAGSGVRLEPAQLLPRKTGPIHEQVEAHLIAGSERERDKAGALGDYVDGVPNHLLLACAYALLAEGDCGAHRAADRFVHRTVRHDRRARADQRRARA